MMAQMEDIFYFGSEAARLFGAWHPPDPSGSRTTGVVVCPSMGQEAVGGHPLCRRLAVVLAGYGYPVLRFDYFGTGDSLGESHEVTIDGCLDDIDTAVDEMRRRSGCPRICLVGLRFGATLAILSGSLRRKLDAIAALNPVTNGRAYVVELRRVETEAWTVLGDAPAALLAAEQARALTGMAFSERFLAAVEAVDLMSLGVRPADRICLFDDGAVGSVVSPLRAAPAFAEGFDHKEIGASTESALADYVWPPGRAPRNVSHWVLTACP